MNIDGKKITVLLVAVSVAIFLLFGVGALMINKAADKAADKVMQRLQRDYAPGPYNPGFDPDRVDPRRPPAAYLPYIKKSGEQPQQPRTWEQVWESQRH